VAGHAVAAAVQPKLGGVNFVKATPVTSKNGNMTSFFYIGNGGDACLHGREYKGRNRNAFGGRHMMKRTPSLFLGSRINPTDCHPH
jgi:hypothetical protein